MKRAILSIFLMGALLQARAEEGGELGAPVDTKWPGVRVQVSEIRRIPGDRLLFVMVLVATAKAPISTLLGFPTPVPVNLPKAYGVMNLPPQPYSIAAATMTEEKTQQTYHTLVPDPKGLHYRKSSVLTTLSPGRGCYMTIQFQTPPPPPPPAPGEPPPKQYVSLLIPQAVGPITHVMLPLPGQQGIGPVQP